MIWRLFLSHTLYRNVLFKLAKMHQSYLIAEFSRYYIKTLGLILFGVSQKFDLVIISPIPTRTHGIGIDAVSSKSQLPIS